MKLYVTSHQQNLSNQFISLEIAQVELQTTKSMYNIPHFNFGGL